MKTRWTQGNTCVYNTAYHIIFCPKFRRKVLVGNVETRLKELIEEKCKNLDIKIESMEVMPDHVHLFVKAKPIFAPHYIVQQLKGYSSCMLRKEIPALKRRLPTLWTRSYYVESIGHISETTIKRYIADQKGK